MYGVVPPIHTIRATLLADLLAVRVHYWPREEASLELVCNQIFPFLILGTDVAGSVRVPAHFSGIYTIKCMLPSGLTNFRFNWPIPEGWQCIQYAWTGRCEGLLLSHDKIPGFSLLFLESGHRPEAMGL